jgi:hypothetical protein
METNTNTDLTTNTGDNGMRLPKYRSELLRLLGVEDAERDERAEAMKPTIAWLHAHGFTRIAALGVLKQELAKRPSCSVRA